MAKQYSIGRALLAACSALATSVTSAYAHPHVFAEARLEVVSDAKGDVELLRHVWRFDDLFSTTVLLEFDANVDNRLDASELETVAGVVSSSIADFDYFQSIDIGNTAIKVSPVTDMIVDLVDGQLLIIFTARPERAVSLRDNPRFSVFDPTFYTAIEFLDDDSMAVLNAPDGCAGEIVIPDAEVAIAQNQQSLTEAFFNEPDGNDMSKIFATRLEVTCN